jgi:hypothetical protein
MIVRFTLGDVNIRVARVYAPSMGPTLEHA